MTDIRALRLAAGLTQAELAARAGTARPNIAAYVPHDLAAVRCIMAERG